MDRHHRKQLIDGPGVGGRTEHRQVGVVGAGQGPLQAAQVVVDRLGRGQSGVDRLGTGPAELFGHRPLIEADVAEAKGGEGVVAEFHRIVPGLLQKADVGIGLIIHGSGPGCRAGCAAAAHRFAPLAPVQAAGHGQHVEHQHGEMAGNRPAAFAHQGGHGDVVEDAAFPHRGHHIVGVVLQGVIGGCRGCGAATVVVNPHRLIRRPIGAPRRVSSHRSGRPPAGRLSAQRCR